MTCLWSEYLQIHTLTAESAALGTCWWSELSCTSWCVPWISDIIPGSTSARASAFLSIGMPVVNNSIAQWEYSEQMLLCIHSEHVLDCLHAVDRTYIMHQISLHNQGVMLRISDSALRSILRHTKVKTNAIRDLPAMRNVTPQSSILAPTIHRQKLLSRKHLSSISVFEIIESLVLGHQSLRTKTK